MTATDAVWVYLGKALGRYAFGDEHPFGPRRLPAFEQAFRARGLDRQVTIRAPVQASDEAIGWFHRRDYIERVKRLSAEGTGYLDYGDTPAFPGVYEAAATVVGSVLDAVDGLMQGQCRRAFVPIAGLHHARRTGAAGFCVFNDPGVAIEALERVYGLRRVGYVDIDAHHGDGVYFGFAGDPEVTIVDIHEDGHYLYPGTGAATEVGDGPAAGTKLNIPLPPGAGDEAVFAIWDTAEGFLRDARPEFILLQCGADGLAGDPLTQLGFSSAVHAHITARLAALADELCDGRLLALGGGGYNLSNIAEAWCTVVETLVASTAARQE